MSEMITEEAVLTALQQVIDPELGVSIVDLGLIYGIEIVGQSISIQMTMTSPGCPLAGLLEREARTALQNTFPNLEAISIDIVWEPQWSPMMMSLSARHQLG